MLKTLSGKLQCSVSSDNLQYLGVKQLTPGRHFKMVSRKVHNAGKEGHGNRNSSIKGLERKIIIMPNNYSVLTVYQILC